jgi:hypothetical protein
MEIFMTTVLLNLQNIDFLKRVSREQFHKIGINNLTEALAAGFGFNKHASLLLALRQPASRLQAVEFSSQGFELRLSQLTKSLDTNGSDLKICPLEFRQSELPLSCWQPHQSDATYHNYSRSDLPIIFIKDKKRKYCSIDYGYHFPRTHEIRNFDFDQAKTEAIWKLLREFQNLAKTMEMPNAYFDGQIFTGWVTKVPIAEVDAFADQFALAYFKIIRELEIAVLPYRTMKAA